jgi:hypothetical protein
MFNKGLITAVALLMAGTAYAGETPITGTVQSKCSIYTDIPGVYGNPTPDKLSTAVADGGILPKIRYDVASADYYTAKISWPESFASSPVLTDVVNWNGSVTVAEVTDPLMSDYETNKIEYNNVTEFDLTVAGTVWFNVESTAEYGYGKSFPGGSYTAIATAECIAK